MSEYHPEWEMDYKLPIAAQPNNSLWNEGVCEGLNMARVIIIKELLDKPESKKLKRIFSEIMRLLDKERSLICLQTSVVTNGDTYKFRSGSIGQEK